MTQSNFPKAVDSLSLVNGGITYPESGSINYLTSAVHSLEKTIGQDPLSPPVDDWTMQESLVEQFAEFVRIECGEYTFTLQGAPWMDYTNFLTTAKGQNCVSVLTTHGDSWQTATINAADYFSPGRSTGSRHQIGTIRYANPRMFQAADGSIPEGSKFFGHVSVVTRMSGQDTFSSHLDSGTPPVNILGNLPEPYDYPTPVGVSVMANEGGIGLWLNIGASEGEGGWNSSQNAALSIPAGTVLKIRYCAVQIRGLA